MLRIHEILVRIRIRGFISLTNGCGSGYADPDPAIFVSDHQDVNMFFFAFEGIFTLFFKDKKSYRSHKTVGINVFLIIFVDPYSSFWLLNPERIQEAQKHMDPTDPDPQHW